MFQRTIGVSAHTRSSTRSADARMLLLPVSAAALTIPLALFQVMGYDINPAFLLAPIIPWAYLASYETRTNLPFAVSCALGVASILIANSIEPDDRLVRNLLSLILLLFPASFFFLGRYLVQDIKKGVFWLAVFSAIFVIPLALRLIIVGQAVRAVTVEGYAFLNVQFFGLPVFAAFGVNALAHLLCIQTTILSGALFSPDTARPFRALFFVAMASALFLVIGSDARSAVLYLIAMFIGMAAYAIWKRQHAKAIFLPVAALAVAILAHEMNDPSNTRVVQFLSTIFDMVKGKGSTPEKQRIDDISTGRLTLWTEATSEIVESPIVGTGFSQWGRYSPAPIEVTPNSGTHIYYLTYLWKGGLLFAIPFTIFLAAAAWNSFRIRRWASSPEGAFTGLAVLLSFCWLAITYDTPNVPSAGALAFFLLGALNPIANQFPVNSLRSSHAAP
ncbi:O-antigen ligase family protein [Ollibium composti]|uniref:O-antigen ligase-related domain-containing protein n=1 Tax=Ollibium composti TaxID=2675109 RepID=A0ABY2Q2P4_9HYPH|nr:O-antigen ligase family protein [Mesorhizobium composti]THF54760.1 hypothetical protein E6C48_21030 [Mesorhizobium composti]